MKKANLISAQQARLLSGMEGRVDIYFTPLVPGAFPSEVVLVNKANNVSVSLDYEDLEFKFEYFFFQIRPFSGELGKKIQSIVVKSIRCLFRCEWKYDDEDKKVIFGRGKIEDVPNKSIACCSDVGFLMLSANGSRVLVYSDDDFPLSVGVTKVDDFIDEYLKSCNIVNTEDVQKFGEHLSAKGFNVGDL